MQQLDAVAFVNQLHIYSKILPSNYVLYFESAKEALVSPSVALDNVTFCVLRD